MNNPIKDNRIVVDKTFAVRLLSFAKSIQVSDPSSEDEKDSMISYATKLLKYQCLTALDDNEIDYLNRVGVYTEYTKPLLKTEDGFEIFEGENYSIYSHPKNPTPDAKTIEHNVSMLLKKGVKTTRLYFMNKETCEVSLLDNKPSITISHLKKIGLYENYLKLTDDEN